MSGRGIGGFGSQTNMNVPEGFAQDAFTWKNMARLIVDGLANSWFTDLPLVGVSDSLSSAEKSEMKLIQELKPEFLGEDETLILENSYRSYSDFGEQIPIDESPLGQKLIRVLERLALSWSFREERVEVTPLSGFLLPSLKLEGSGQWLTYFGMPFDQVFKIFRDVSGKERILWSSDILAATRPFEHVTVMFARASDTGERFRIQNDAQAIKNGGLTLGQLGLRINLPVILKWLMYLAETPFPSNILSFSRPIAFGEKFPKESLPIPYFINKKNSRVAGAYEQHSQGFNGSAALMPNVIEAGWILENMSDDDLATCLTIASNGLTRMMTILEDGYINHNTSESSICWDVVLGSAVTLDSDCEFGKEALGLSTWIPVSRIGLKLNSTYRDAPDALRLNNFESLESISLNGAGPYVANCINSLVFSHLLNSEFYYMIDRLLEAAYLMDVEFQSTNALSNWGIALYKRGNIDEAIDKFKLALSREDRYAENEASWWLSKIYGELGENQLALEFKRRCDLAGGYEPAISIIDQEDQRTDSLEVSSIDLGESNSQAYFCSNCGIAFRVPSNFCSNCGARRG